MPSYSTRDIPAKDKLAYWNALGQEVFVPMETRPADDHFDGDAWTVPLGRMVMFGVSSTPADIIHSRLHVQKARDRKFKICVQLQGELQVESVRGQIHLEPGDLFLTDNAQPCKLHHAGPCVTAGLVMSAEELKRHLPDPEEAVGVRMAGNTGLAYTASLILRSLCQQAQSEFDAEVGARVADSFLEMYAAAWLARSGMQPVDSAVVSYRRLQIKRYIEAQLRDPNLSARSVASAFGISPRYLHMLFAKEGETVSNYILRRRLDQCVRQLSDPLWRKRTITEIAFSWGFNNATHFARVFRHRYSATPREYRNGLDVRDINDAALGHGSELSASARPVAVALS